MRGRTRTTITVLTFSGFGPDRVIEGGISSAGFEAYGEHLLAPTLQSGQIVVMDKLHQHRSNQTRPGIAARGPELWFLPAFSLSLNAIEEAFSKVKTLLRTAAARTHEALITANWRPASHFLG